MIQYVLTVSEFFPKNHYKNGQQTNFYPLILRGQKKHTIRGNYELWRKRFEKIKEGKALLSLRQWEGKPYNSKQIELIKLDNTNGIGLEKLTFSERVMSPFTCIKKKNGSIFKPDFSTIEELSKNDGLYIDDFQEWFKGYDLSKEMAIIHFTDFRYCH